MISSGRQADCEKLMEKWCILVKNVKNAKRIARRTIHRYGIRVPREIGDAKTRKKTQTNGVVLINERNMTRTYVLYGELRGNSTRFARDIQAVAVIGHNIARSLKTLPSASDTSVSA